MYVDIRVLYACRKFHRKITIILVYVKMTKKSLVKSFVFSTETCLFYGGKIKSYFFTKFFTAQIFRKDVHIEFYFRILHFLNYI